MRALSGRKGSKGWRSVGVSAGMAGEVGLAFGFGELLDGVA